MKVISTKFQGLKVIKLNKFSDLRGDFIKLFDKKLILENFKFSESYLSVSKKGTVRGLHAQSGKFAQSKLIFCLKGKLLDLAVDLRKKSRTFGLIYKKKINSNNLEGVYIPKGFAHGLIALEENTTVINFCSNPYNTKKEFGINIHSLNIKLPVTNLKISKKDKKLSTLKDVIKNL